MADLMPLRGTSLHDGVAARLRAMVFDRELGPGEWIGAKALAQTWAVSRVPVKVRGTPSPPCATVKQCRRHAE